MTTLVTQFLVHYPKNTDCEENIFWAPSNQFWNGMSQSCNTNSHGWSGFWTSGGCEVRLSTPKTMTNYQYWSFHWIDRNRNEWIPLPCTGDNFFIWNIFLFLSSPRKLSAYVNLLLKINCFRIFVTAPVFLCSSSITILFAII